MKKKPTAEDVEISHEDSDVTNIFDNDTAPDCEYSSSQKSCEINWSSLEESENFDAGDDEESNPNSSYKID